MAGFVATVNGCAGSQPSSTPSPAIEPESKQAARSLPTHTATGNAAHAATDQGTGEIIIGTLQHRDEALVISASGHGPRFSVRSARGHVIARGLSEAELGHKHEELHRIYRNGVARQPGGPFLDARLDPTLGSLRGSSSSSRAASH